MQLYTDGNNAMCIVKINKFLFARLPVDFHGSLDLFWQDSANPLCPEEKQQSNHVAR